jgi:hypothetical protein
MYIDMSRKVYRLYSTTLHYNSSKIISHYMASQLQAKVEVALDDSFVDSLYHEIKTKIYHKLVDIDDRKKD